MGERPEVRIGTAEREEAVHLLGEHFAAGRLTLDEFDERVTRATQARTRGDLVPLFRDLPSAPPALAPPEPRENIYLNLVMLVPLVLVALLLLLAIRHPIAIVLALVALWMLGRRAYRLLTEWRARD
ncbi:DUF1707 domain-containing protein [Rhodococcus coprophilus]|uniref:Domain of uncharacterized function (DUF1707) n=1 Tax=Rhodococcus coprophilus TaxID=38310 RepID=A0A2X4UDX6_9NOCA|nr:DUF1707 domain-containing protein [Rhodococcus coprophilus]MBM7460076.1 hypothetical protein [Rhodococcus coprophilus]SQI38057.1 Domain of uncharacterised function (DUF1707) [Rhodococcus coprophilus]